MSETQEQGKHGNYKYLQFGPVLAGTNVDSNLVKELLKRGEKTTKSNVHDLAGHIETENEFEVDDYEWFVENFKQYFIPYFKKLQVGNNPSYYYGMKPFNRMLLNKMWINYMKCNEFNPPHTHSGSFSFVLYLDVPNGIKKEIANYKGTDSGPGTVSFYHGEDQKGIINAHRIRPIDGDLWIFPAVLKDMVAPFRSDVTRISVSGNIFITDYINRDHPIQPGEFLISNTGEQHGKSKR